MKYLNDSHSLKFYVIFVYFKIKCSTQVVPKNQLLLFKLSDGWEPLCEFLGKPVPKEDFPHRNKGASITDEVVKSSYIFAPIKKELFFSFSFIVIGFSLLLYYIFQ